MQFTRIHTSFVASVLALNRNKKSYKAYFEVDLMFNMRSEKQSFQYSKIVHLKKK